MNTMKMPGFTAEHSLYRTDEHFRTGAADPFRVLNAEVRPQLYYCHRDPETGEEICVNPGCRVQCFNSGKHGKALERCLARCDGDYED